MIQIRHCEGFDELEACVQLQIETWGYDESDIIPRKTFLISQKIGGQVIGAFETDNSNGSTDKSHGKLVGFAMSLPGVKTFQGHPMPYLHSHMLAVRESHRNRGIGAQLKWKQRDDALTRGIGHMEWTFDPLAIKNAFLNIHRLGAIAREYRVDFYGVSSSRLQGGLPTDRLVAEWELDSPRVKGIIDKCPPARQSIEERIIVTAVIDDLKADKANLERALAVQLDIRQKFQLAFSQGLAVIGFSRDHDGNGIFELGSSAALKHFLVKTEETNEN
jgi:predicted GNAT superfamily acetyltransferase